jgi:hypothetical protein
MKWPFRRNGHAPVAESASPALVHEIEHRVSREYNDTLELLTERIGELELESEDVWFQRIGATEGVNEFSRAHLAKIIRQSRLYYLRNPLINRAVSLQAMYVFGQGVSITGRAPAVNEVVQAFLDDPANQVELTSHQARGLKEIALQIEGNLFFALFTDRTSGRVRVRTLPVDEVTEIITDPDDRKAPWYYKRVWSDRRLDLTTGRESTTTRTSYYPDWRHRPATRPATIGEAPIAWDTPVYHVKVGGLPDMRFGVPETYAALDWAQAHKRFLEQWATIVDALSRFAWKMTPKGGARGVAAAKARLGTTLDAAGGQLETNPAPVTGSVAILPEGADLAPIPKTGATVAVDDSRRLLLMVASALGLPETFFGDASVGNHATAKTLDRPTELKFLDRRTLWADIHGDLLSYVIDQAALSQQGPLRPGARAAGDQLELGPDPATGEPLDRSVNVDFPPLLEHDVGASVGAVVAAATLGGHPSAGILDPRFVARLLLQALGVADIDEALAQLFPEPDAGGDGDDTAGDDAGDGAPLEPPSTDGPTTDDVPTTEADRPAVRITAADIAAARAWIQALGDPALTAAFGGEAAGDAG